MVRNIRVIERARVGSLEEHLEEMPVYSAVVKRGVFGMGIEITYTNFMKQYVSLDKYSTCQEHFYICKEMYKYIPIYRLVTETVDIEDDGYVYSHRDESYRAYVNFNRLVNKMRKEGVL